MRFIESMPSGGFEGITSFYKMFESQKTSTSELCVAASTKVLSRSRCLCYMDASESLADKAHISQVLNQL